MTKKSAEPEGAERAALLQMGQSKPKKTEPAPEPVEEPAPEPKTKEK